MVLRDTSNQELDEFRIVLEGDGEITRLKYQGRDYGLFSIPFSRETIETALSESSPGRLSIDPLVSFGMATFNALFSGPLGRELWTALADAERSNHNLRLRILSSLERTQHLPWELLYDPSRGDFVCLSGRFTLVRSRAEGFHEDPLAPLQELRILVADATPSGQAPNQLLLNEISLAQQSGGGRIQVQYLTQVTPELLQTALASGSYDVLHFLGNCDVVPQRTTRGGIRQALRLSGPHGQQQLAGPDFAKLLADTTVRLVILSASHSDWIARSVARYIPAAIGFREEVQDSVFPASASAVYRGLLEGVSLEACVTSARQAVDRAFPGSGQWCKLIAYLQRPQGLVLSAPGYAPPAFSVPQTASRERSKLLKQIEIYQQNLATVKGGAYAATGDDQSRSLQQKIDELQEKLQTLV